MGKTILAKTDEIVLDREDVTVFYINEKAYQEDKKKKIEEKEKSKEYGSLEIKY